MTTGDDHSGLKIARIAVFPSVPWQRCRFHLQQNASERVLKISVKLYRDNASDLAAWMEENLSEGWTVFSNKELNASQQKKLRTTNMVEFQNKELKKLTGIIRVFPNKNSLLCIAAALLIELKEKWQTEGKAYIGTAKIRHIAQITGL